MTNKPAHLSSDRVKKQATIFGAADCAEQARLARLIDKREPGNTKLFFWNMKILTQKLDLIQQVIWKIKR